MSQKSKKATSHRYYGWKRQQPDRRDFLFCVPHHIRTALPPFSDLFTGMGIVLQQGDLGSCGPNTTDSLVMFDQQKESLPVASISRLQVYYATRKLMDTISQDSGVDNRTMMKALNQFGFCDETLWPYNISQFTVNPPQNVWDAAAPNKIDSYAAVSQDLDSMRGCIASGFPFMFGFTVYESFESDAATRTGIIPMPQSSESVLGGHDVGFCGYSDTQRQGIRPGNIWPANTFRFKNSWGDGWGDGGYGYMPYSYATDRNLSGDFWVVNAIPGAAPQPPNVYKIYEGSAQVGVSTGYSTLASAEVDAHIFANHDGLAVTIRDGAGLLVETVQPATPTPTPVPPTPPAPPGPSIQAQIDAMFRAIEKAVARRHTLVMILEFVHGMVNAYLKSHPISGGTLQDAVNTIFAALEAAAPNAYERFLLEIAKNLIDQWIQRNSGAKQYSLSTIDWHSIWAKIQAALHFLGPIAVPLVEAWIATLPLTDVQKQMIDALIEQVMAGVAA